MSNAIDAPKPKVSPEEKSTQDNPNGYVTYQCDACKIFPIKDMRYTIGGEVDIGKCRRVYGGRPILPILNYFSLFWQRFV